MTTSADKRDPLMEFLRNRLDEAEWLAYNGDYTVPRAAQLQSDAEVKWWILNTVAPIVDKMDNEIALHLGDDARRNLGDRIRRELAGIYAGHPEYDPAWAPCDDPDEYLT